MKTTDIVTIHRPGRQMNGWVGRVLDHSPDPALVWVAFNKGENTLTPPDERTFRRLDKAQHKLVPVSNLVLHAA